MNQRLKRRFINTRLKMKRNFGKVSLTRRAMQLPHIGPRITQRMLENYNPYERFPRTMILGEHGERIYLEPLAGTRDTYDLMFKVYTSEKAQKMYGMVTTIYIERLEMRYSGGVEQEFRSAIRRYNRFMQERLTEKEWQSVANGTSFQVNASGFVALDGREMSLTEYMKKVPSWHQKHEDMGPPIFLDTKKVVNR